MSGAVPLSALREIAWPAPTDGRTARQLALQYQFRRSERWSADQMQAHQWAQLQHLLGHADRTMPFWRQRLRAAGVEPGMTLTEDAWARIPILTRAELQNAGTALHCRSIPPAHGEIHHGSTSGSSGKPVSIIKTDIHQTYWSASALRDLLWQGVDFHGKMAVFRRDRLGDAGPGKGRRMSDWGGTIAGVFPNGPAVMFEVRRPLADQVAWLLREDPDYLLAYPSLLGLLADHFRATGQRPRRLRGLRAYAEVLTPDLRALCQDVFGVPVKENYSCEEAGYLALQCPRHDHLHALSETVKLEVLDDAGSPCKPGQVGRVIITPLHNFAMPLFRYELGDLAEPGPACDCGRTLPVLRRILGRLRGRVVLPSGETRLAYFGGSGFNQITALRQFQVIQTARTAIDIRLVVRAPLDAATEARIVARIHDMLGHQFATRVIYVDNIPTAESGKFQDFINLQS